MGARYAPTADPSRPVYDLTVCLPGRIAKLPAYIADSYSERAIASFPAPQAHQLNRPSPMATAGVGGRQHHNARFRTPGEELGLILEEDNTHGWSAIELEPHTADVHAVELTTLADVTFLHFTIERAGRQYVSARGRSATTCSA